MKQTNPKPLVSEIVASLDEIVVIITTKTNDQVLYHQMEFHIKQKKTT